jgi:WS/DGAT/MGAT family acyltransferase
VSLLPQLKTLLSGDLSPLFSRLPPKTRFNGDVSAHRVFESIGLPLADFKVIRSQSDGATLNDIFLAIVGGTLNKYLGAKGELPETSMIAGVPMSLRGAEKGGDRGNQVGGTLMPVYSEIADPLERLAAISESSQTSKRVSEALGKEFARDLLEYVPAPITEAMLRNFKMPGTGLVVSNVRGPDVPLYMAGARLVNYTPVSIAIDGFGLNITGFSYAGTMQICAISCREMLPDPAFFTECLRESFAELKDAAMRRASEASKPKPPARRRAPRAVVAVVEAATPEPVAKEIRKRTRRVKQAKRSAKRPTRKSGRRRRAAAPAAAQD